jgi:hypothetical protein
MAKILQFPDGRILKKPRTVVVTKYVKRRPLAFTLLDLFRDFDDPGYTFKMVEYAYKLITEKYCWRQKKEMEHEWGS